MSKKQQIIDMLAISIFIKEDVRQRVLAKIDALSAWQINALFDLLSDADKKQTALITSLVKKNPNFISDLNNFIASESSKTRKAEEKKEHEKEEDYLKKLEHEIEEII